MAFQLRHFESHNHLTLCNLCILFQKNIFKWNKTEKQFSINRFLVSMRNQNGLYCLSLYPIWYFICLNKAIVPLEWEIYVSTSNILTLHYVYVLLSLCMICSFIFLLCCFVYRLCVNAYCTNDTGFIKYIYIYILWLSDCWLRASIRKVLRPATSAQIFLVSLCL